MSRLPYAIASVVLLTGFAWTIHLVVSPEPWEADAALAIAIGALVLSVAAMAALLLGRGRWTRYFAAGLVIAELLIVLVAEIEGWLIAATILSAASLIGLGGPWLKGWLRERPAAGAPAIQAVLLAIASFAVVPLVGVVSPGGLRPAHGVAGALGILLSWGYLKGGVWALWLLRLAMPVVLVAAAVASPIGGTVLLVAATGGILYLAWSSPARLAVDPLPAELPAPRMRRR